MISDSNNSRRQKVLVATASVGAGHNAAARAIVAALKARAPDIDVQYLDVLTLTPWLFRAYYAGGYGMTVTWFSFFYGIGYWITNRPHKPTRGLLERRRLLNERWEMRRLAKFLRDYQPDLIVNTHFLAPPLVGRMIAHSQLDTKQMVVLTDNDAHRYWYAENVDRWFVPADFCVESLSRWGIDPQKITVSGIPIHPRWTEPLDREKILADWNLPTDKKIVLISAGTDFTCFPVAKIARQIADLCPNACAVVLAGHNKKLLARLAKIHRKQNRVIGISFTDRLHELVEVCSLMVTKAGGITTAECLSKATPMILLKAVPGQEAANEAYYQQTGAAVRLRRVKDVAPQVRQLLDDEQTLKSMSQNAKNLHKPATRTIVEEICNTLNI